MSYTTNDPRSQLSSSGRTGRAAGAGANVAPQYFEFDRLTPGETTTAGGSLWWVRSQACVLNYADTREGDSLSRADQADEYVVLLPDSDTRVQISAGDEQLTVTGRSLMIVPPGPSDITSLADVAIVRMFAAETAPDLCALCHNREFYETPDPNVAAFRPWPEPPSGPRVRAYAVDDVEPEQGRFGRIFRCSTFMVNWLYEEHQPRDPTRMSPHHHDDFEQLSLQLAGDYIHHIRTPWTVDMTEWRDDEHRRCTSPSLTVIPPPSIHTSQAVGDTRHQLVDIFAPPRFDFSERPGWILNADEYPVPAS